MSRRKPTLQLTSSDDRGYGRATKFKTGAGLGLLGNYDDSEEELENGADEASDDEPAMPVSTLDSKVADFLKEINDLDNDAPPPVKKPVKQTSALEQKIESPVEDDNSQDFRIVWGPWKQCVDENTNHPYYWNTDTNEVSWTLPEDVMKQYNVQTSEPKKIEKEASVDKKKSHPKKDEEPKAQKPSKKEDLLISKTSLKAVLEEKRRELEKQQKKMASKNTNSEKDTRKLKKKHESRACDFDIDAELDSALDPSELPPKRSKLDSKAKHKTTNEDISTGSKSRERRTKSDKKSSRTGKDSDRESDDMDICDDLSKYDMTELLPGGSVLSPAASRSQSPFINKAKEQASGNDSVPDVTKTTISEDKQHKEIEELSTTLIGKLQFLDISKNNLTDFHKLLMEIEVRSTDWKAGELSSDYHFKKLKQAEQQLEKYEKNAVPPGWSCQWDSDYGRYFYKHKLTGEMQWSFPKDVPSEKASDSTADSKKDPGEKDSAAKPSDTIKDSATGATQAKESASEKTKSQEQTTASSQSEAKRTAGLQKPDGKPDATAYPAFNTYQQYWNMASQYGMHYGQPFGMYNESFRNSPHRHEAPPPPGEDAAPLPPSGEDAKPPLPPAPPDDAEDGIPPPPPPPLGDADVDDGTEMEISDVESTETPPSNVMPNIQVTAELQRPPVEYSSLPAPPLPTVKPVGLLNKPFSNIHTNVKDTEKTKKLKKSKKDKGAVKRPPREMVGMVAKWQKAKQEIEDEEKRLIMESEEELNNEMDPNYRINKWRAEQLESGKAASNANFEPISDDWRKRVKQRKNKVT